MFDLFVSVVWIDALSWRLRTGKICSPECYQQPSGRLEGSASNVVTIDQRHWRSLSTWPQKQPGAVCTTVQSAAHSPLELRIDASPAQSKLANRSFQSQAMVDERLISDSKPFQKPKKKLEVCLWFIFVTLPLPEANRSSGSCFQLSC